jgi:large subunit ribosomal protein L10
MAITRTEKEAQIEALKKELEQAKMVVVTHYRGLSVAEIAELRKSLKQEDGSYRVMKNTLIQRAFGQLDTFKDKEKSIDLFTGPTALAYTRTDEITAAQVVAKFSKKHEAVKIVGGLSSDGTIYNAAEMLQLASLPSKQQLLGQVVGTIAAPLNGFASVLQGNLRGLVYALNGIAQAKK